MIEGFARELPEEQMASAILLVAGAMLSPTQANEKLRLGLREIYVYYADGQGESKLKIPAAGNGTARNMNTVAKLAEMAAAL